MIDIIHKRLAALSQELIRLGLLAEVEGDGRPLEMQSLASVDPPTITAFWSEAATAQQKATYQNLIDGWDWSAEAQTVWEDAEARRKAKASLTGGALGDRRARALLRLVLTLGAKINEVVAFANTKGGTITPLPSPTMAQALEALRQRIDDETDPEA